jgi:hypothetical protein
LIRHNEEYNMDATESQRYASSRRSFGSAQSAWDNMEDQRANDDCDDYFNDTVEVIVYGTSDGMCIEGNGDKCNLCGACKEES